MEPAEKSGLVGRGTVKPERKKRKVHFFTPGFYSSFFYYFSVLVASLILHQASGVSCGCSLEVRLFSEKFSGKVHPERGVGSVRVRPCWERRETEHKKYMASLPGLQKRKS